MKEKLIFAIFAVVAIVIIGIGVYYFYTYYGVPRCEACGMLITPEMDANFKVIDVNTNQRVWVCCPGCMLRVVAAHPNVHIEALDSWYGTSAPKIIIEIRNGTVVSVDPPTTKILLGSAITNSCSSNRIAINDTSVELLLKYGYNDKNPLTVFKTQLPAGTPVLTIDQALPRLKAKGIAYVPPSMAFIISIIVIGIVILIVGAFTYKKLVKPKPTPKPTPTTTK
jgi:ABC-type antimicrobial peptide transport system permease subunit